MVNKGVTKISIFVSLEMAFPHSLATMEMTKTANGPPAPPKALAEKPTVINENNTNGGQCKAYPMAAAMAKNFI